MTEFKSSLTEGDVEIGQIYELVAFPGIKHRKIGLTTTMVLNADGSDNSVDIIHPLDKVILCIDDLVKGKQ
ncbi:hypothetical protein CPT_Muldoon_063 [Serratia phage Muldoon]|uniref:Uncharacterized protein n=1 Tax=Serratia phage Muldoon TaxID=2601678 RepID=A0A5P8PH69_9CAUD|nr:hypothetical protein HYP94_gp062 [Serratia phage Muldoon]QFR56019.1 hypothetical protein CPT_Muldoon_063 [Serratia phage Muldoon]UNA02431.1 hypothetical protein [Serratia phage SP1]